PGDPSGAGGAVSVVSVGAGGGVVAGSVSVGVGAGVGGDGVVAGGVAAAGGGVAGLGAGVCSRGAFVRGRCGCAGGLEGCAGGRATDECGGDGSATELDPGPLATDRAACAGAGASMWTGAATGRVTCGCTRIGRACRTGARCA